MLIRLLLALALLFTFVRTATAQINIPNVFTPQTRILSAEVNANFSELGTKSLNRTGGTMTGTLTSQVIVPDGNNTRDLGSTGTRFKDGWFAGTLTAATVSIGDGAAGTPTLRFTNSTTTGLFRQAADVVGVSIAGTERARLAATGISLGTIATPSAWLTIGLGANDATNYGRGIQITNDATARQQMAFIRNGVFVWAAGIDQATNTWGFGPGQGTDASFVPTYFGVNSTGFTAFGAPVNTATAFLFGGSFSPASLGLGITNQVSITVPANAVGAGFFNQPTLAEAGSGTHADLDGARFDPPTITGGGASVTQASTVRITGAPVATGAANYALRILGGDIDFSGGRLLTNTTQPGFLAYNSATDSSLTGQQTVDFDTEVYDHAGNFAADTFTAPATGIYLLCTAVQADSNTDFSTFIVTSNRQYLIHFNAVSPFADVGTGCVHADMDTSDVAIVRVEFGSGTASIVGGTPTLVTWFSGRLVP